MLIILNVLNHLFGALCPLKVGLPRLSCGCFRKSLEKLDVGSVPLIPDLALGNGVPSIGIVLGAETGLGAGTRRHGRVIALVEGIAEAIRPAVDLSVL